MSENELTKTIELSIEQIQQGQNSSQYAAEGWWDSTANWMKKKYFNGTHLLDLALNDQKSNNISLFGMNFKSNEQARLIYSSVLWFTYRQNLKFHKIKREYTIKSDVGWGCMIRVGQMMLAHSLRYNLGFQFYDNEFELKKLLRQFILQQGKYSVQKIASKAHQIFNRKPGQWYSPSEIAHVLCDLQNNNKQSNMKMLVLDSQFEWEESLDFIYLNLQKNEKIKTKSNKDLNDIQINPTLIVILCRIGYKSPEPQLLESVKHLLKKETKCIGILGGRPGKAHYIFGTSQKNFIYLDPHCVKQNDDLDSFFCNSMFCIPHQSIDPSMGLCFYVKDKVDFFKLHQSFCQITNKLPFYSYNKKQKLQFLEIKQKEERFEIL